MRISPSLFLLAVILTGAGCFKTSAVPVVLPNQPERESENMAGDVSIETVEIQKDFALNEFAECKIEISYPVFDSADLPSVSKLQTEHEINHFIAEALGSDAEIESSSELETLAQSYLEDCKTQITAEYNDLSSAGEELFTNLKRSVGIVYNVKLNESQLLSLGLDEYSYSGGAHPSQRSMYLNVDRVNDRLVTLSQIIKPEHLKVFLQYEKTKLLAENSDNLYQESAEDFEALVADHSDMTAEAQLAAYGDISNFYLTPTSIVTYYDAYEIAPYAAGPIFVEIPYQDIKDFLSITEPIGTLMD